MNIKDHIIFNTISIFVLKNFKILKFSIIEWNILLITSIIFSFFPDIDHPISSIGNKLKFISTFINKFFGHRKITHSILFLIIIYFLSKYILYKNNFYLNKSIHYGIILGCINHMLADMLTKHGICLLWPIKFKFKFNKFFLFIIIILIFLLYTYNLHQ
ncbi:membrane protein [endosymbiont of Euscepes postfasciatus]|uniref:metal-dependent hydrolase n=1 Tax=endosymbiont of Euscepes postfasciatus TaxID=650377 RepID=UPI000DC72391|nr:metal-dependent hydrolase [endosymbiont of Euscepes postfasciatus]BBA84657.1 membrane protein [endosymbiont of Euscepes postfasciatus]